MFDRRWLCLPLTCLAVATACAGDEPDESIASTTATLVVDSSDGVVASTSGTVASTDSVVASTVNTDADTSVPEDGVELPDTPAGRQLRWVLDEALDAPDSAYPDHFSPEFLAQIPVADLRAAIADSGITAVAEIVTSTATELFVIVNSADGELVLSITVETDQPHLITGLLAQPAELPDPPDTWEDIDAAIADAAPRFTYLAAEVDDLDALTTIRSAGPSESVPLGSAFKLYVLGALVQAIEVGEITWDDELTITDELKSLPSGELQDRPDGATVTVREAAEKMIQISDNTATDLLIDRLGRDAVEAMLTPMGMSAESQQRTLPFLTTRELFTLKWGLERSELDAYIAADLAGRRQILAGIGDQLPTLADFDADVPVAIDDVEWFATAPEMAAAHLWLDAYSEQPGFEPLAGILGSNPGVPLDPGVWSQASFKGGSEPGLVFLGWLLHRDDGRRFVVVVSASNLDGTVDELAVGSAAQGIIELIATEP
jgi:beta-lactamase class A